MRTVMLSVLLLVVTFHSTPAQDREEQIPFDAEGNILVMTKTLNDGLGVFDSYGGFREAMLFRTSDSLYLLEVYFDKEGSPGRDKRILTQTGLDSMRVAITRALVRTQTTDHLDQEGRGEYLATMTTLGLCYYGWAIPAGFEMHGTSYGSMYLLTAGSSFLIPFIATQNSRMTEGMATFAGQGAIRGAFDGVLLAWMIDDEVNFDRNPGLPLLSGVALSVAENIIAARIAASSNMLPGRASTISILGNFGAGVGLGTWYTLSDESSRLTPLAAFLGTGLGYYVGDVLSRSEHYSTGDATVLSTAAALGAAIPFSIMMLPRPDDYRPVLGLTVLGTIGGIWAGHELLKGHNFTTGQGLMTWLGTGAGALIGLGLAAGFETHDANLFPLLAALGGTAGFALVYSIHHRQATARPDPMTWNMSFNPAGLLTAVGPMQSVRTMSPVPLMNISARF